MNTFDCLIPVPRQVSIDENRFFALADINGFFVENTFAKYAESIRQLFNTFSLAALQYFFFGSRAEKFTPDSAIHR